MNQLVAERLGRHHQGVHRHHRPSLAGEVRGVPLGAAQHVTGPHRAVIGVDAFGTGMFDSYRGRAKIDIVTSAR